MEILGDDIDMYCDVLSHVLMKTRNSEQQLQKLSERYVVIPASQYYSSSPTPVSATKTVRQISVLQSNKKHGKARELAEVLKSQFPSVNDIAKATGENKCTIHRILCSPKKRIKETYVKKFSEEVKNEGQQIFFDDKVSYSLSDARYVGIQFMSTILLEAYSQHYLPKCSTEHKISFKAFCKMRPHEVHTIQQMPLCGCKCEYCQNLGIL